MAATASAASGMRLWGEVDDHARAFEKIVRLTKLADIGAVWVAGRAVK